MALALNDLSSSLMTASAGDDNSTKELKGFVIFFNDVHWNSPNSFFT